MQPLIEDIVQVIFISIMQILALITAGIMAVVLIIQWIDSLVEDNWEGKELYSQGGSLDNWLGMIFSLCMGVYVISSLIFVFFS